MSAESGIIPLSRLGGAHSAVDEDDRVRVRPASKTLRRYRRFLRLQELGFASYAEYLDSPHWRKLRVRFAASDQPQDCMCGETERLQLHHMTYERVGAEELSDLMWLCKTCHAMVHVLEERGEIGLDLAGLVSEQRAARHAADQAKRDTGPAWEEIHKDRLTEIGIKKFQRDVRDVVKWARRKGREREVLDSLLTATAEAKARFDELAA